MAVPENRDFAEMAQDIPNTYVPLRNTLFVTLGAAFLESQALDAIERREGARAEAILREHSRITRRNLLAAVQASQVQGLPGVQLIRERA